MITRIKTFKIVVWGYDNEYEINNVPNYDLFNKHVFDILKEVETIEFVHSILASKWIVCEY